MLIQEKRISWLYPESTLKSGFLKPVVKVSQQAVLIERALESNIIQSVCRKLFIPLVHTLCYNPSKRSNIWKPFCAPSERHINRSQHGSKTKRCTTAIPVLPTFPTRANRSDARHAMVWIVDKQMPYNNGHWRKPATIKVINVLYDVFADEKRR